MSYVIGIDTGGTYTDAVLLDTKAKGPCSVVKKAKVFTLHHNLESSIIRCLNNLMLTNEDIINTKKIVLSTTLATNTIIEGKTKKVGLIIIGDMPKGSIATDYLGAVEGETNIKGSILTSLDSSKAKDIIEKLNPKVDAWAISGAHSVRNPVLEQEVKAIVRGMSDKPTICGHEIMNDLGFLERTNTAVINAGLLPVMNQFIDAIHDALNKLGITAPVFMVRGDGNLTKTDSIKDRPIDTILSGPACSMIGAIYLANLESAVVSDMGGTTTDAGVVKHKKVELSNDGAVIGKWKIRIKSGRLYTFGLGGDSKITIQNGIMEVGPERVLPACRGGGTVVTPTDILHYTGEFIEWDKEKSKKAINKEAKNAGLEAKTYIHNAIEMITDKIIGENIVHLQYPDYPICAIGAPAETWYKKAKEKNTFNLIIPECFEVANAVGAASAVISEEAESAVRPGEEGIGFLAYTKNGRYYFKELHDALDKAVETAKESVIKSILDQNLNLGDVFISCNHTYLKNGELVYEYINTENNQAAEVMADVSIGEYICTVVKVSANGRMFVEHS